MKPSCVFVKRLYSPRTQGWRTPQRGLLTLAIETSCDDTCVAVLEKHNNNSATLHFNSKLTSDNLQYGGVHPIVAHESHQKRLGNLINQALQCLPLHNSASLKFESTILVQSKVRKKPDFVTVTKGPGMRASLMAAIDTGKGLAIAWQIPIIGVNHMLAHALTPRMVSALESRGESSDESLENHATYPYLSLLVSGGNTLLVHSKSLCDHRIISATTDIAIGNMIDKAARDILPASILNGATDVMYGSVLESFAFSGTTPEYDYKPSLKNLTQTSLTTKHGWVINPPFLNPGPGGRKALDSSFSYSGIGSKAKQIMTRRPNMDESERKDLAREVMRVAFEHLASRVIIALESPDLQAISALVVAGGVASNRYLKHILRAILDSRGHQNLQMVFPPPKFCTDNAAMVAWTGIEMFEAGWRCDLDIVADPKLSIEE